MRNISEMENKIKGLDNSDGVIYLVKNKDEVVGMFKWVEELGVHMAALIEDIRLPYWVVGNFNQWVVNRTIAKHRARISEYLEKVGLTETRDIIEVTHGLSLNDTLWIVRSGSDLKWSDVNLYDNEFRDIIARTAFSGGLRGFKLSTTIPELSTDGAQEKCWVRMDNIVYLLKEGSEGFANAGLEPYSEVMVTQLLKKLKYNHTSYDLINYHKSMVSRCPLFSSCDLGFISFSLAFGILDLDSIMLKVRDLGYLKEFCQMMVLDYLILNTDRHLNNFGFLVDNNTYEIVGFAPLFDHGYSLLNFYMVQDDLDTYLKDKYPRITDRTFEDVAKQCKKILGNEHNVDKLIGFKFDGSELTGLSDSRIALVQKFVTERVNKFLSW